MSARVLVKIGQIANLAGVLPSKVRYYVKEGLLETVDRTRGGYYLFEITTSLERLKLIQEMKQKDRLSLPEIREKMKSQERKAKVAN